MSMGIAISLPAGGVLADQTPITAYGTIVDELGNAITDELGNAITDDT